MTIRPRRQLAPANPQGQTTHTWGQGPYPVKYDYDAYGRMIAMTTYRAEEGIDGDVFPASATGDTTRWHYDPATGELTLIDYSDATADLVVYQDPHVVLLVPKAQTSQWELQLMTQGPVGNILEADAAVRASLDQALLTAMQALTGLGATLITVIEFSKRFDVADRDQRLLYSFLPRLPESPGAFSEAQSRWINGHYPEDVAQACRLKLATK